MKIFVTSKQRKIWLLIAVIIAAVIAVFVHAPIPQDPAYHHFADTRTLLGIPHFWNVISNLPFIIVGAYGLATAKRLRMTSLSPAYIVFCVGAILVGFGSGYYHWKPSSFSLVWDRLPMTLMFMALLVIILMDRISVRLSVLLFPLLILGVLAVTYWYAAEQRGHGDLRAYVIVQFLPMLLIPLLLLMFKGAGVATGWLSGMFGMYVFAKLFEYYDVQLYSLLIVISGHSVKHVWAALAVLCAIKSTLQPVRHPT